MKVSNFISSSITEPLSSPDSFFRKKRKLQGKQKPRSKFYFAFEGSEEKQRIEDENDQEQRRGQMNTENNKLNKFSSNDKETNRHRKMYLTDYSSILEDPSLVKEKEQKDYESVFSYSNDNKRSSDIKRIPQIEITKNNSKIQNVNNCYSIGGWIRVYCGPDRSEITTIEPSRMIHCFSETTTEEIVYNMQLPTDYTLWMQIGGSVCHRLNMKARPHKIQEDFLKELGYANLSRSSRLEIDPEMRYLLRFFIGPSEINEVCKGIMKSGKVDVLKGLVYPQWKKRCIAVIGNHLYLFPANDKMIMNPDIFNLFGAEIVEHAPCYERLILKIIPKLKLYNSNFYLKGNNKLTNYYYKSCDEIVNGNMSTNAILNYDDNADAVGYECFTNSTYSIYNGGSVCSINSIHCDTIGDFNNESALFLGFEESWERDLWSAWLLEATAQSTDTKRLDICNSGLQTIPEVVLQSIDGVEEILAGQNKLQEIGLKALSQFSQLKILRLPGNGFTSFPNSLLSISGLITLDLTDNLITRIPDEITSLQNLEELHLDRNEIIAIPNTLRLLKHLKSFQAFHNRISELPTFLIKMCTTMGLVDTYTSAIRTAGGMNSSMKLLSSNFISNNCSSTNMKENNYDDDQENKRQQCRYLQPNQEYDNLNLPLTKISLRANQLKGNIILGNYGNLTQLDVSENEIEILDLRALNHLESLQCCRNRLVELTVNGASLSSLITGNNELVKLSITPIPVQLRHLDISFNKLTELPQWLNGCHQLRTLFANNNKLKILPEHLFSGELNSLHTLQLGYNELKAIPIMLRRKLPLQELFLQCNQIKTLPDNFFYACENLTLLNISSNYLSILPPTDGDNIPQLQKLYATKNILQDQSLKTLMKFKNLRILHAAYNQLKTFPEECVKLWPELEEIILSGNHLKHLPENLAYLSNLKVLRIHSNQLQSAPSLSRTSTLRVLDLAHNQLDKVNLISLVPNKLQFLDLSCNFKLQVDPKQLQTCRAQRPMSLVDVSGRNRITLPTSILDSSKDTFQENVDLQPSWKIGFSETAGNSSKLYISQLRLPNFCNIEGLFGLFDGELNSSLPSYLTKIIPKILLEERTVKETANEYMKYTLLSAHRELKHNGQKYGVYATLCHICREKFPSTSLDSLSNTAAQGRKFVLRVASVGEAEAYLIRKSGYVCLTPNTPKRQLGNSACFPLVIPDPEISEITLGDNDEYLVICNKTLWEIMNIQMVIKEIRTEENVILAAKRIQDVAQSFGAEENISIILVKFNKLGTDVDLLMRELRQTVRKKSSSVTASFCKCGCCCESNNCCCHSVVNSNQFIRQLASRSDRSSPSGQSDQTANEIIGGKGLIIGSAKVINTKGDGGGNGVLTGGNRRSLGQQNNRISNSSSNQYSINERRNIKGGVAKALRSKIDEEYEKEIIDETDSALSEEQFKCWEYMLEQNTQLLFDKELNTISKAFTKNRNTTNRNLDKFSSSNLNLNGTPITTNLLKSNNKILSASSPQLIYNDILHQQHQTQQNPSTTLLTSPSYNQQNSFLSKHFGSARSFHPSTSSIFKSMRFNSNRLPPIGGGPNAAYFGSLQRLMPYNLEYDFAVIHERNSQDDSLETENRMRQYWDVATTEL